MPITAKQLAAWFDDFSPGLLIYARQWARGHLAEDLVQEAFLRLAGESKAPEQPRAWLIRTLRNAALDRRKTDANRRAREASAAAQKPFFSGPAELSPLEAQQALEMLPANQREVITLKLWAGANFQEIADLTGQALSTVHGQYRSGLEALRQHWEVPS